MRQKGQPSSVKPAANQPAIPPGAGVFGRRSDGLPARADQWALTGFVIPLVALPVFRRTRKQAFADSDD
jgi:hypothetical protein